MKARLFIATILFSFLYSAAAAQSYQIRVTNNTNLRASYSLDSAVLASAPAGATLQVVGQHNRWLQISRDGRVFWMADWVSYTRIEQNTPTQTHPGANIDNCCFVDRQCNSDQEWSDGWWAYQNGQCVAPAQSQPEFSVQQSGNASSQIDNCCFAGWPCNTDQEWRNGYWAYQNSQCNAPAHLRSGNVDNCCSIGWNCADDWDWNNGRWAYANNVCVHPSPDNTRPGEGPTCCDHGWRCTADYDWIAARSQYNDFGAEACGSPIQEIFDGVILEGSARFIARVKAAFAQIKRTSPEWYAYSITASRKIREALWSGTLQRSWNLTIGHIEHLHWLASVIVHESCHQQRWLVWVWRDFETEWLAEEAVCDTEAINAVRQIAPGFHYPRGRIDEFSARGIPFDVDASANREWERAKLILSRLR